MIPPKVDESLQTLSDALLAGRATGEQLNQYWKSEGRDSGATLSGDVKSGADNLAASLPGLTRSKNGSSSLCELFKSSKGDVLFTWCEASIERADVRIAPLLFAAKKVDRFQELATVVARGRLVQGPLGDALSCAPLLGRGDDLALSVNSEARARLEILIWEAGASARQMPDLGEWIFGSAETFDALIAIPATGSLRGRVLAARCLELCALGLPAARAPQMLGRALQVLQPLLLHPEPLVSTHAARALGLLAGTTDHLQGMLLDWLGGDSRLLRERAITASTSLPAGNISTVRQHVVAALSDPESRNWALAAAAAGTPYLFHQNRELWDTLSGTFCRERVAPLPRAN